MGIKSIYYGANILYSFHYPRRSPLSKDVSANCCLMRLNLKVQFQPDFVSLKIFNLNPGG